MWMGGMHGANLGSSAQASSAQASAREASSAAQRNDTRLRELERHVARLALLNQALWEMLRDRMKATDVDLEQKANEIDLRDGIADGQITPRPLKCPNCNRVSNSKHSKCLYCGQLFQSDLFA